MPRDGKLSTAFNLIKAVADEDGDEKVEVTAKGLSVKMYYAGEVLRIDIKEVK